MSFSAGHTDTEDRAADLFGAFADPTRLRLLALLADGELCVCDLCSVLELAQPKVSRHLARLRSAGLVEVRRDGKWKHYSLSAVADRLGGSLLAEWNAHARELGRTARDKRRLAELERDGRCR